MMNLQVFNSVKGNCTKNQYNCMDLYGHMEQYNSSTTSAFHFCVDSIPHFEMIFMSIQFLFDSL